MTGAVADRVQRGRWWRAVGLLAIAAVGAACSHDSAPQGGEIFARPTGDGADRSDPAASPGVVLAAPAGTPSATLSAAADVVRGRLARMGVTGATVTPEASGVAVAGGADPYQLHAAAQQHASVIAPITTTAVGPCKGPGTPSVGAATRCYVLGAPLTGVGAVSAPVVQSASGAGWKLTFAIDPTQYKAFRAALETAGNSQLAIVGDGQIALVFGAGVPALQSAIGPPLTEEAARMAAATLAVDTDLPVALSAPELPPPPGPRVDVDFWTAALGVDICGTWLANAPAFALDTGVHSHGDGLVYVHPFTPAEAGDKATLGLFLQRGGWEASADRLRLWDGTEHRSGTACPDGRPATVRWFVDGVEQQGDPSAFRPRNGQVIVLSFSADAGPPGPPPQMQALYLPALGAAT